MTAHFQPWEHCVYTTGQCATFVVAAHPLLGGVPTVLVATDPRHLDAHGWPPDEPLELHVFLHFPDDTVVDIEGRRTLHDFLYAHGVREDYSFRLETQDALNRFGAPDPACVWAVKSRLRELGWDVEVPSSSPRRWSHKRWEQAEKEASRRWKVWVNEAKLDYASRSLEDQDVFETVTPLDVSTSSLTSMLRPVSESEKSSLRSKSLRP